MTSTTSKSSAAAATKSAKSSRSEKRTMTSAIEGLSVADVRRGLAEVRQMARNHSVESPLYITDKLSNGMPHMLFCLKFMRGHSDKRHSKGKKDA